MIDAQLAVFEGHFDGRPILPGVAQIDWAARFARHHLGRERVFSGMRRLKFRRVIQPPTTVCLALDWCDEAVLQFHYHAPQTGVSFASGSLCFD